MHIIAAVLALVAGVYFFVIRARNAAAMTNELADVAGDVMAAARRFGFRRKYNTHPTESIEDPRIAIAGIADAFLQLDGMPTQDLRDGLQVELQREFQIDRKEAEELMVLGMWMINESQGAQPAITRLSKVLYKLSGTGAVTPLLTVVQNTLLSGGKDLSERQREALHDVKRALHIR